LLFSSLISLVMELWMNPSSENFNYNSKQSL
jgi:hypothetical protein